MTSNIFEKGGVKLFNICFFGDLVTNGSFGHLRYQGVWQRIFREGYFLCGWQHWGGVGFFQDRNFETPPD